MPREISEKNGYKDKLLKLIPSEIVAAYMTIDGMIPEASATDPLPKWVSLGVLILMLALIPPYLKKFYNVQQSRQVIFTMLAFAIWVYWLGRPFTFWVPHVTWLASILLIVWTLLIPIFINAAPALLRQEQQAGT